MLVVLLNPYDHPAPYAWILFIVNAPADDAMIVLFPAVAPI